MSILIRGNEIQNKLKLNLTTKNSNIQLFLDLRDNVNELV